MRASERLGACWTGTLGRGTMGPSGDWAKLGDGAQRMAAAQTRNGRKQDRKHVMKAAPRCERRHPWRGNTVRGNAKAYTTSVYSIRRKVAARRCRDAPRFLQWEFFLLEARACPQPVRR